MCCRCLPSGLILPHINVFAQRTSFSVSVFSRMRLTFLVLSNTSPSFNISFFLSLGWICVVPVCSRPRLQAGVPGQHGSQFFFLSLRMNIRGQHDDDASGFSEWQHIDCDCEPFPVVIHILTWDKLHRLLHDMLVQPADDFHCWKVESFGVGFVFFYQVVYFNFWKINYFFLNELFYDMITFTR